MKMPRKRWYPRPGDMCLTPNVAWMAIAVDDTSKDDTVTVTWLLLWGSRKWYEPFTIQTMDVLSWSEELNDGEWVWQFAECAPVQ